MRRATNKLTDSQVKSARPKDKPFKLSDGSVLLPDGDLKLPDGTTKGMDGSVELLDGSVKFTKWIHQRAWVQNAEVLFTVIWWRW